MCRNIKPLFNFEPPATDAEMQAAALQYVRKVSGFRQPSHSNQAAFDLAVQEIAEATKKLMTHLHTNAPHKDRAIEAQKAAARNAKRFS